MSSCRPFEPGIKSQKTAQRTQKVNPPGVKRVHLDTALAYPRLGVEEDGDWGFALALGGEFGFVLGSFFQEAQ